MKRCAGLGASKSYSQWGEDWRLLDRYFCGLRGGTYLEIGANDGVTCSNTKFYEDNLGWSGLLIEAFPPMFAELSKRRPLSTSFNVNAAICSEGVVQISGEGTQAVVEQLHDAGNHTVFSVPCQTLGSVIKQAGLNHITFFSLDVEGAELMVLQTMDWNIPVCIWEVEMLFNRTVCAQVRALLVSNGYIPSTLYLPGSNEVYEHPDLSECLARSGHLHGIDR
mmetsp:Transcript_107388/g.346806  ORF Transcript_107388/g.346806 Transcript_107388/m.346806 type:complete len:222 (-) Transcript_107388:90-755(-)